MREFLRSPRLIPSALWAGATIWLLVLVTAPGLPVQMAAAVYAVGGLICHQLPERSFHLGGVQLPVCARCVGIYAGVCLGLGAWSLRGDRLLALQDVGTSRLVLAAGASPTIAQVMAEWGGWWFPSNASRAAAGLVVGAAVALVVGAAATLHWRNAVSDPRA